MSKLWKALAVATVATIVAILVISRAFVPHASASSANLTTFAKARLPKSFLHWQEKQYDYTLDSRDLDNGKWILADYWLEVNANNQVERVHARFTLPDGTLSQEVVGNLSKMTLIWGPAYRDRDPSASFNQNWCIVDMQTTSEAIQRFYPLFADQGSLISKGTKQPANAISFAFPEVPPTIVSPSAIYKSSDGVTTWKYLTKDSHESSFIQLDNNNRLISSHTQFVNDKGITFAESWRLDSDLLIFQPSSALENQFNFVHSLTGGCN